MASLPPISQALDAALLSELESNSIAIPQGAVASGPTAGNANPPAASATTSSLEVGRIVLAEVVQPLGDSRALVAVNGQPIDLSVPEQVTSGQTLRLQVLQTSPSLEFHLLGDGTDEAPSSASSVTLSSGALLRQVLSGAPQSQGAPRQVLPLIDDASPRNNGDLGAHIALALQRLLGGAAASSKDDVPLPGSPSEAGSAVASADTQSAGAASQTAQSAAPASTSTTQGVAVNGNAPGRPASGPASASTLVASEAAGPGLSATLVSVQSPAGAPAGAAPSEAGAAGNPGAPPAALTPGAFQIPVWHDQNAELSILPDTSSNPLDDVSLNRWRARLSMDIPGHGRVEANLSWGTTGATVALTADTADFVQGLRESSPEFVSTLKSLQIPVIGLRIAHE